MPSVLRSGPYRIFFYAGDRDEPPHVHVERKDMVAKFWLKLVRLQTSGGFSRVELRRLEGLIRESAEMLLERWYEFFGG